MQKPLAKEHPELFHYTNAAGLAGILQSQTLWATHYAYLNDSEEIKYFLEKKFPDILWPIIDSCFDKLAQQDQAIRLQIKRKEKNEIIHKLTQEITVDQKDILLSNSNDGNLSEPYITSFCTSRNLDCRVKDHGLLSQWRSYGRDGGYAIIFDTQNLLKLSEKVGHKWKDGLDLFIGDVVYSSDPDTKFDHEFEEDLEVIKNFSEDKLNGKDDKNTRGFDKIYLALMKCACRYKHWGFKEENEVRIIALPQPMDNDQFLAGIRADGIDIPKIPRKHFLRSGVIVPYINLFEDIPPNSGKRLPIRRIIVGPTANAEESKRRVRAVKILLDQYAIEEVDVTPSDIPYIG